MTASRWVHACKLMPVGPWGGEASVRFCAASSQSSHADALHRGTHCPRTHCLRCLRPCTATVLLYCYLGTVVYLLGLRFSTQSAPVTNASPISLGRLGSLAQMTSAGASSSTVQESRASRLTPRRSIRVHTYFSRGAHPVCDSVTLCLTRVRASQPQTCARNHRPGRRPPDCASRNTLLSQALSRRAAQANHPRPALEAQSTLRARNRQLARPDRPLSCPRALSTLTVKVLLALFFFSLYR